MAEQSTTLEGQLVHITYYNRANHYLIAKFRESDSNSQISILGYFPDPSLGENLRITGTWQNHAKYGTQFRIAYYEIMLPETPDSIRQYLLSAQVKGLGPKTVARIIRHFGMKTLEVIDRTPQQLTAVRGIGQQRLQQISDSWKAHHTLRDLLSFLRGNGVDLSFSTKIFREYGADAIDILQKDPFRIINDIPGIGFYVADQIIKNAGEPIDELKRAKACAVYTLNRAADEGHVFIQAGEILKRCAKGFGINGDLMSDALDDLAYEEEIKIRDGGTDSKIPNAVDKSDTAVYLKDLFLAEQGSAEKLAAMLCVRDHAPLLNADRINRETVKKLAIKLSAEQLDVVGGVLSERVAVITGGPGTGKTTLIRAIAAVFDALGMKTALAAPTGRAARRISEVTHKKAATIHKLLQYNPMEMVFERNRDTPLDADVVVVDEASMVDIHLMHNLLDAIPVTSKLILVGDTSQLPSVGPGNVLADLIDSKRIKTYTLTNIFRQARQSKIIINAHQVCRGRLPALEETEPGEQFSEFNFIEENNPERAAKKIVQLCSKTIPRTLKLHPVQDIQVITPMHKGVVGTLQLNKLLQKSMNPNPAPRSSTGIRFKSGDKVMHLKNNYQKEVFNGDIGVVASVNTTKAAMEIDYDGRIVPYELSETNELTLAYAISVHKSQGSEYPVVVLPLLTQHYMLLQRNLLYTAITRGKQLVVIIGSRKAVNIALKNDKPRLRSSRLAQRIAVSKDSS
ncbi:MAG: ATP-dependent RecD-like DNA helicase [Deltaproteobacteria bacterium]|nr:ATP-dependent RecD-like DNA helicase [Deltaproteobacteria bacterium]